MVADLVIRLSHPPETDSSTYEVRMHFQAANSAAGLESVPARIVLKQTDFDDPLLQADEPEYGRKLTDCLFADHQARTFFEKANAAAQMAKGSALRVRLEIAPDSPLLHGLRWELLRDPWSKAPLVDGERVWFSRHLNSRDWTPVFLRTKEQLKALIVVANPIVDPNQHPALAQINGDAEIARARGHLMNGGISAEVVRGPETISQLQDRLRKEFDVLYLVCHGRLAAHEGVRQSGLWLEGAKRDETDRGVAKLVLGSVLIDLLSNLPRKPRLVVLVSCQSANDEEAPLADGAPLAALGPKLAEAGIPAVLAMQGKVPIPTVASFMNVFFQELARDGRIDRAVGAARWAASKAKCLGTWMPALFSRLDSNALWNSGFATKQDAGEGFGGWSTLLDCINEGKVTPVLGPGLLKDVFGTARQTARTLSRHDEHNSFPLAPYSRDELTQVNQFFSRIAGPSRPYQMLRNHQLSQIKSLSIKYIPNKKDFSIKKFDDHLSEIGKHLRQSNNFEPHRILANLPLPLFLTANPDDLLADALSEAGKFPKQALCPWKPLIEIDKDPSSLNGTDDRPLIYHLLGRMNDQSTMVMTEDDYIHYIIGLVERRDEVPGVVRTAMSESMLVFLGFQVEHWTFRALLRGLLALTEHKNPEYPPIAVQVDPDENDFLDVTLARQYLSKAFPVGDHAVQVYWGTACDFLEQLAELRSKRPRWE